MILIINLHESYKKFYVASYSTTQQFWVIGQQPSTIHCSTITGTSWGSIFVFNLFLYFPTILCSPLGRPIVKAELLALKNVPARKQGQPWHCAVHPDGQHGQVGRARVVQVSPDVPNHCGIDYGPRNLNSARVFSQHQDIVGFPSCSLSLSSSSGHLSPKNFPSIFTNKLALSQIPLCHKAPPFGT